MANRRDDEVKLILDEAESQMRCAFARDKNAARMLGVRRAEGQLAMPHPRLYVRSELWEELSDVERHLYLLRAYAAKHPDWVFCLHSAAAVHGLFASRRALETVYVASRYRRRSNVVEHRMDCSGTVEEKCGLRVTPLDETMFSCIRDLDFPEGLAIADSGLRVSGLSRAEALDRFASGWRGFRGIGKVLSPVAFANPLSENGGESFARAAMIEEGFQVPTLQVELPDPISPGGVYRVDFLWRLPDGSHVAGEFDGMRKYNDPRFRGGRTANEVLIAERERESHLNALGLPVMRFKYADVLDRRRFVRLLEEFGIPRVGKIGNGV